MLLVVVCYAFVGGMGLAGQDEDATADYRALQGEWHPYQQSPEGKPPVVLERLVITGKRMTLYYRNGMDRFQTEGALKLFPEKKPKQFDLMVRDAGKAGEPYRGVYDIKDGVLKLLYRGPRATRPKDFSDTMADGEVSVFLGLKRAAAKKRQG